MYTSTDQNLLRFAENFRNFKKVFNFDYAYISLAASGMLSLNGADADIATLAELKDQFNDETSVFSVFKNNLRPIAVAAMYLNKDKDLFIKELLEVYSKYKTVFRSSIYLGLVAILTLMYIPKESQSQIIADTKELYSTIKSEHSVITSDEDLINFWLMAYMKKTPECVLQETELYFDLLKNTRLNKNAIQSLGNILTLYNGDPSDKAKNAVSMMDEFKVHKHKYSLSHHEIISLGYLSCSCYDIKTIVKQTIRADKILSSQKGFGIFSVPGTHRLMYAGLLTQKENEDLGFCTSETASKMPSHIINEAIMCNSAAALTIATQSMVLII